MGRTVINQTENKQTVILNDSPEGIEGGYYDEEMVWHELGGSEEFIYHYDLGNLFYLHGSLSVYSWLPNKVNLNLNDNGKRRSIGCSNGDIDYSFSNGQNEGNLISTHSYWYMIPVPEDASSISISIDSGKFIGPSFYNITGVDSVERILDPGWSESNYSLNFDPGTYDFVAIAIKYDSAGTTFPTEVEALEIDFGR